jgi:hypothetical protein
MGSLATQRAENPSGNVIRFAASSGGNPWPEAMEADRMQIEKVAINRGSTEGLPVAAFDKGTALQNDALAREMQARKGEVKLPSDSCKQAM